MKHEQLLNDIHNLHQNGYFLVTKRCTLKSFRSFLQLRSRYWDILWFSRRLEAARWRQEWNLMIWSWVLELGFVHNKDNMWMCHCVWKDNDDLKMDITAVWDMMRQYPESYAISLHKALDKALPYKKEVNYSLRFSQMMAWKIFRCRDERALQWIRTSLWENLLINDAVILCEKSFCLVANKGGFCGWREKIVSQLPYVSRDFRKD